MCSSLFRSSAVAHDCEVPRRRAGAPSQPLADTPTVPAEKVNRKTADSTIVAPLAVASARARPVVACDEIGDRLRRRRARIPATRSPSTAWSAAIATIFGIAGRQRRACPWRPAVASRSSVAFALVAFDQHQVARRQPAPGSRRASARPRHAIRASAPSARRKRSRPRLAPAAGDESCRRLRGRCRNHDARA